MYLPDDCISMEDKSASISSTDPMENDECSERDCFSKRCLVEGSCNVVVWMFSKIA
jgi:hypothetical protein